MTLLRLTDSEGDPMVIESSAIVAVTLGSDPDITLIHTHGWRFKTRHSFATVLAEWCDARLVADARQPVAHPDAIGWRVHPVVEGSTG